MQNKTDIINKKQYFLAYTIIFFIFAALLLTPFIMSDTTLIRDDDAYRQHLKALIYISKWLRSSLAGLLHGSSIATWSFSLGYGADIITSLHYYGIGEPLNLLSVFVPAQKMYLFYESMIIVRMYLAGLSFSAFILYFKKNSIKAYSLLVGSMTYIFCGYMLLFGLNHPFFITPFILFPLLLLGIEKELREGKPLCFIIAVFLSGICNFYNLYILIILSVIYYLIRIIPFNNGLSLKPFIKQTIRFIIIGTIGILMAAFILVPVITAFLADNRIHTDISIYSFYLPRYYKWFPSGLLSFDFNSSYEYSAMGYGAAIIPALFLCFSRIKKHPKLIIAIIGLFSALLIPYFGWASNGFTYVVNRWLWAFALLSGYIVAVFLPELLKCRLKTKLAILAGSICYLLVCFFVLKTDSAALRVQAILVIFICITLLLSEKAYRTKRISECILFTFALLGVAANPIIFFTPEHVSVFRSANDFSENSTHTSSNFWFSDASLVSSYRSTSEEFFRYASDDPNRKYDNSSVLYDLSTTQYYWSLSNGNISQAMTDLAVTNDPNLPDCYHGFDERTGLNALAGVKYYVTENENVLPYGYIINKSSTSQPLSVYENLYTLPLAYTYDSYYPYTDFMSLEPIKKQQLLLSAVVINDVDNTNLSMCTPDFKDSETDYSLINESSENQLKGNHITVNSPDTSILLEYKSSGSQETYLYLNNLSYSGTNTNPDDINWRKPDNTKLEIEFLSGNDVVCRKYLPYYTDYYKWNKGQKEFLINSGYQEEELSGIRIRFAQPGKYSFDDPQVLNLPMAEYAEKIASLKSNVLTNVDLHDNNLQNVTNTISGDITLEKEKFLCFSIPYQDGWTATVDGETQKLYQCNLMYSGLLLNEGTHHIVLSYHTPNLRKGIILSIAGFLLFFWCALKRK